MTPNVNQGYMINKSSTTIEYILKINSSPCHLQRMERMWALTKATNLDGSMVLPMVFEKVSIHRSVCKYMSTYKSYCHIQYFIQRRVFVLTVEGFSEGLEEGTYQIISKKVNILQHSILLQRRY